MNIRGKRRLVGIVVAGLLAAVGLGIAVAGAQGQDGADYVHRFTEKVARILGKQPEEVRSAVTQAQKELLDEAVAEGAIPAERAEQLKRRAESGRMPFFGPGMGAHRRGRGLMGEVTNVDGALLSVKTRDGDKTVLLTDETEVRNGREAADRGAIQVGSQVRVEGTADTQGVVTAERVSIVDKASMGPGRGSWPGKDGGMGTMMGQFAAITDLLGLTPQELMAQLSAGKNLAEIAGPEKTSQLIDTLVGAMEQQIESARAAGKLSEEQAAQTRANVRERVTEMVNAKGLGGVFGGFGGFRGFGDFDGSDGPEDSKSQAPSEDL